MDEFWKSCLSQLEQELPPQQVSAWIRPISPLSYDSERGLLCLALPNRFKLDWVKRNFLERLQQIASNWYDKPVQISLELVPNQPSVPAAKAPSLSATQPQHLQNTASASVPDSDNRSRLNGQLTFENFVTGKANQLARAAAQQVAQNPGVSYNPLFLYGGVGLGKTHLVHAIGNAVIDKRQSARVRYVHADQYVSDVVKAYQKKAFDDFKRYYHSLDLLLIDDIQFISEKKRTQEEFFYAFEAMVAQARQIIITSDTYPKELSGIDDRLISRFDSGLTVAIEPPELEMRVAILLRKAQAEGFAMPEEVAFFIAKHLRSNVRELEGALHKVLAYLRFHGRDELTVEVCRDALKDLLSVSSGQITVENIQKTVADFYKIKVADMYSKRRPPISQCRARSLCIWPRN